MNDPQLVRRLQRLGNVFGYGERFIDWNRSERDAIGERWTVDELHDQRLSSVAVLESMNLRDVRMVK